MRLRDRNLNSMDEDVIINDVGESLSAGDVFGDEAVLDLPTSIFITNLDVTVFDNEEEKIQFEDLFQNFGEVSFQYFKSFRRARVNFESSQMAASARIQIHHSQFCDRTINCYFAQAASPKEDGKDPFLQPPSPVKQYLISPPASPPVGWEPVDESHPTINYELLAALANLAPGESHELHPPSGSQPGIVIHPCPEGGTNGKPKPLIQQTACPERSS